MGRLIDEDELLKQLELYLNKTLLGEITVQTELSVGEICSLIKDCPTVDAEPVRHGHWEEIRNDYGELEGWICECGHEVESADNYCSNCGAKMDAE